MRASGKNRPCKEQGIIPDHPESGSSRIQKQAVATAPAEGLGQLLMTIWESQGAYLLSCLMTIREGQGDIPVILSRV